jgi:hypothetical protein
MAVVLSGPSGCEQKTGGEAPVWYPAAAQIRDLVGSRQMIEVILDLDATAEGDGIAANEFGSLVRDE